MKLEFDQTDKPTNTAYAPLVALSAYYQEQQRLKALEKVSKHNKEREYRLLDKLIQVLLSMLAGLRDAQ